VRLLSRDWLSAYQVNHLLKVCMSSSWSALTSSFTAWEGGMGQVFKARHRALGRIVALKIIREEALTNPVAFRASSAKFRRRPSSLIPMWSVPRCRPGSRDYYLAMEFMEGVDLAQMVKQSGPLPVLQACDYVRQAALACSTPTSRASSTATSNRPTSS